MAILSSPLTFLLSVPPFTRAFTAVTFASSSIYAWLWWTGKAQEAAPYLLLVPASSLFHPWTFLTSALIETSIMEVCTIVCFLAVFGIADDISLSQLSFSFLPL